MRELLQPSRRNVLCTSAAALLASTLPYRAQAAAQYRRKEISDSNTPIRIRDSYKKAISAMLQLPPADPRNWYRHAFVHIFDCPHGNWWFLPWHRAYLGWFEQICRELSGDQDFALPYWDWTKTPRVPAVMFEDVLDPNHSSFIGSFSTFRAQFEPQVLALWSTFSQPQKDVLAQRGLSSPTDFWDAAQQMFFDQPNARGLTAATPDLDPFTKGTVAIDVIRSALRTPTFAGSANGNDPIGFASAKASNHSNSSRSGILESQPHDNIHGAMGGMNVAFMISFLSPVDPIFFLHHANLDRLWDVWTRRQAALGRATLPSGADLNLWLGEQFLFFSDEKGQSVSKTNAGDYSVVGVFDYDYSPGSGEDEVPAVVAGGLGTALNILPQSFSARITSPVIGGGEPAGGVTEVPGASLRTTVPEAPSPIAEITLNIGPADLGRRFQVRVSTPGSPPVEAGTITVFRHHVHGPNTFSVRIPESLASAAATGANTPLDIRVLPIPQSGGQGVAAGLTAPSAPQVTSIQVRTFG
jgi:tyrosinase